jgi:MFS transporter, DHA2 family, multidrug resistance protein
MADQALVEDRAGISTNPLVGVVAVLIGGSLSTLNGRLLSVALPDLRGALHLSVDEAAWIPAAYNMAVMFIGVFSVYLGAVLGPRRVLLFASVAYTVLSLLMPFSSSMGALIWLQVLAGLTSGTFYPLTLSFILVSLPVRVAHLGLACYAMSILFSANIASSLSGWYVSNLSWRWTFWVLACAGPAMAACVYFGIPRQPLPQRKSSGGPSWRGLLYWSVGLSLIYGALDQGERLHWFDSAVYPALLASGLFLIVVSLFRHYQKPNPFIAWKFLRNRSTILLGGILFFFRFFLLATAFLIPGFLAAVLNLRQEQIGRALIIVACLQFGVAWIGGFLLRGTNVRLLMAVGFAIIGLTSLLCSRLASVWSAGSFIPFCVAFAVGESFALLGLVGSILLQVIGTGAVGLEGKIARPFDVLTFSSFFHTVRLMGGEIGTVLMLHFVTQRTKFHANLLGQRVQPDSASVQNQLTEGLSYLGHTLSNSVQANGWLSSLLGTDLRQQATTMAYADAFLLLAYCCVAVLIIILFIRLAFTNFKELAQ